MRLGVAGILTAIVLASPAALAQRSGRAAPSFGGPVATPAHPHDLRARFGVEMVKRLLEASDSASRLRGIARAADVGSPEAVQLLTARTERAVWKSDPHEALALARALAPFADKPAVRDALESILKSTVSSMRAGSSVNDGGDPAARFELARETAALALVRSGDPKKLGLLVKLAGSDTPAADASKNALVSVHLPPSFVLDTQALTTPAAIELAAAIGDVRVEPTLRNATHASSSAVRASAVDALAELGDPTTIAVAKEALGDRSPHVRVAGARALARANAPERFKAIVALLDDDATLDAGIALAAATADADVVKALARRLATAPSIDTKKAVIAALGRQDSVDALRVLATFAKTPELSFDVAHALAVSPNEGAMRVVEKMIADPATSRLGVRAYVARRRATEEGSDTGDAAIESLRASKDGGARALGSYATLLLGKGDPEAMLGDRDARVRRAVAMALGDDRRAKERHLLAERLAKEPDEAVRTLSAVAFLDPTSRSHVPTLALEDRARSVGGDAPLSILARAARKAEAPDDFVAEELASPDPLLRAHAARGLAESAAPDATGLLASAYAEETDVDARRAIVLAIAAASPRDSVSRTTTLKLAATLDPDPVIRGRAVRALAGVPVSATPEVTETGWLKVETADGSKAPAVMLGAVARADGIAVPIVFDDDGIALVPGLPPGPARLVLAPRFAPEQDAPRSPAPKAEKP